MANRHFTQTVQHYPISLLVWMFRSDDLRSKKYNLRCSLGFNIGTAKYNLFIYIHFSMKMYAKTSNVRINIKVPTFPAPGSISKHSNLECVCFIIRILLSPGWSNSTRLIGTTSPSACQSHSCDMAVTELLWSEPLQPFTFSAIEYRFWLTVKAVTSGCIFAVKVMTLWCVCKDSEILWQHRKLHIWD